MNFEFLKVMNGVIATNPDTGEQWVIQSRKELADVLGDELDLPGVLSSAEVTELQKKVTLEAVPVVAPKPEAAVPGPSGEIPSGVRQETLSGEHGDVEVFIEDNPKVINPMSQLSPEYDGLGFRSDLAMGDYDRLVCVKSGDKEMISNPWVLMGELGDDSYPLTAWSTREQMIGGVSGIPNVSIDC